MNKKIIVFGMLALIVIGIIGVTTASDLFNDDFGSGVVLYVAIPQAVADFLESLPEVQSVDIHSDHTKVYMEIGENAGQIITIADLIEHKTTDNLANTLTIAGSPPMPICMRDRVTGVLYGLYLDNGQLNLVFNDALCQN